MTTESQAPSDFTDIRRTIRVLGALPSPASNPMQVKSAAKLLHGRLHRAGIETIWHEPPGEAPLVIAGTGPLLVVTYLDDADPEADDHSGLPPIFEDGAVHAHGILRKAGVIAATVGALSANEAGDLTTLVIETDRSSGSHALGRWLGENNRQVDAVLWEVPDLPIPPPAVFHSAFGHLRIRLRATAPSERIPLMYGGVVSDPGSCLAAALADLVSQDHEVRLDGFYDNVAVPDEAGLAVLGKFAEAVRDDFERISPQPAALSPLHLAMGAMFAPSLTVRELSTRGEDLYLPASAEAIIDIQLVPGQSVDRVRESLRHRVAHWPGHIEVEPLLIRPPVEGRAEIEELRSRFDRIIPASPNPNPAGIFETLGIPSVGFAAVGIDAEHGSNRVAVDTMRKSAQVVRELIAFLRQTTCMTADA